jgi:hypothetical protein
MIKCYAIVENSLVENVIVADDTFVVTYEENNPTKTCVEYDEVNEDDTRVARIGEGYIDGFFVNGNQAVSLGLMTIDEAKAFPFHSGQEYREEPSQITDIVTMRQARLILLKYNLLKNIEAIISSLPSPQKEAAQIEWEYASEVRRDSQLIQQLIEPLGLTSAQMDQMFVEAAAL